MYHFSCPSCLKLLFSSDSIAPTPVPKFEDSLITVSAPKISSIQGLRLVRPLRCKCGFSIGEWVLSSEDQTYDCWLVNGIWSSDRDLEAASFTGDIVQIAADNEKLRHELVARLSKALALVEGLAIQLIELTKKYFFKLTSNKKVLHFTGTTSLQKSIL